MDTKIIRAKHMITGQTVTMFFKSVKQAKYFNKYFKDFREIGVVDNG